MSALVVYDSAYGNTARIADAIRAGLEDDATARLITDLDPRNLPASDFMVIGSPTQGGKPTAAMLAWLKQLPPPVLAQTKFAAFDTRLDAGSQNLILRLLMRLIRYAAPRIADVLTAGGATQLAVPEGFIVMGKEGPLVKGEKERAVQWAASLAEAAKR
jgi:flavodoxin I